MKNITPRENKVLLKTKLQGAKKKAGIELPNEKEIGNEGTILAVGKGITDLKKGQRVVFNNFAGKDIEIDGENYVIVESEEILAIIK